MQNCTMKVKPVGWPLGRVWVRMPPSQALPREPCRSRALVGSMKGVVMIRSALAVLTAMLGIASPRALAGEAKAVDLAKMAGWDIVVADDAPAGEAFAAEEFRTIFAQASGVELPIVKTTDRPERHVFIGAGKAMQASPVGFAIEKMGGEDLRIIARDQLIAIAGGRPRGTLYGVYTFLEDYAGVRFLAADHVHVPKLADKAEIGPLDRTYHPPLLFRWTYYGETNGNPALAARLRVNTVGGDPKYGGTTGQGLICHTFGAQIPSSQYGKEHPEYFAMRNGQRLASGNDWYQTQPCLTNPDVLKIVTAAVLAEIKAHPERDNISVCQNDNVQYCQCPNCKAIDDREGTAMGSLLTFVNAVGDNVAKEYPKVKIGTLSYQYSRTAPKTIKPRPNVQIQLCSIECCQFHPINDPDCPLNVPFCADMEAWSKLTDQVFIWNYNTNFSNYLLPCPNLRNLEPNVRYFVSHGAKGIFMQAAGDNTGAELSELRNYVMANLLWDPSRSGEKLRKEFLDLHYGKAAPPIRRYIEEYHNHAESKGQHHNCYGGAAEFLIDEKITKLALDAFEEALKLAGDEAVKARVEKASICAYRAAVEPIWVSPDGQVVDAAMAQRMRPLLKRLFELTTKYHVPNWSEGGPIEGARQRLRNHLGLKPGEEF
jgi:hypothetical protein